MLSVSILGIKENIQENIKRLEQTTTDYFHVDVMDGLFVSNKTLEYSQIEPILKNTSKKLDIHLMVQDVKKYIDDFSRLNPEYITFHYEAVNNPIDIINYIKSKNIKVGISIKPATLITNIFELLEYVDLVLVMSVEPGFGGQKFLATSEAKINELYNLKKTNNFKYLIEVDGGINNETKLKAKNADILVVGSYITNNNYEEKVNEFKKKHLIFIN